MASRKDGRATERQRRRDEKGARKAAKRNDSLGTKKTEYAGTVDEMEERAAQRPVLEQSGDTARRLLKAGMVLRKFSAKRSMLQTVFRVDTSSMQIVWQQGKQTKRINLEEVREVRRHEAALRCKVYRNSNDAGLADVDFAFVVIYGTEFKLRQLCLAVPEHEGGVESRVAAFAAWTEGLLRLCAVWAPDLHTSDRQMVYWLKREWHSMAKHHHGPGLRDIKAWLQKVSCKLSNRETKELFSIVDRMDQGSLSERQFYQLYAIASDALSPTFRFVVKEAGGKDIVSPTDLQAFLREHQGQDASVAQCTEIVKRYTGPDGHFRVGNFVAYLHSMENAAFSPRHRRVYQPMDQPLAHYFISTSHNTYLFGNQFKSESSFEAYIKCLEDGCRCVEIDTWDNPRADDPYDQIVVTHGNTLTTKIKFRDVVPAIMEHAFTASPYPVILSIEQHCGLQQQACMAEIFKKELGAALVTGPLPECSEPDRDCYPSPEQLKHRIIIKHKKLRDGSEELFGSVRDNKDKDEDISQAILTGHLRLEDKVDGSWTKHFFSLTKTKISYTEITADTVGPDDEEDADEGEDADDGLTEGEGEDVQQELHHEEPWFHGKLAGGRHTAAVLLERAVADLPVERRNGMFLVRESDTSDGYVVSVWCEDQETGVRHCRIRFAEGLFFLNNVISFETLYELIEYYRREPLQSAQFHVVLTDAVPQLAAHEGQPWWHGSACTRQKADEVLRQFETDGAFLVRPSETSNNSFAISFRSDRKVRHCRVRKEGRMYSIGESEFDSLVALVEYYETRPLYKKTRLTEAVDAEAAARLGVKPDPALMILRANSGGTSRTVRALYEYTAQHGDELSFPVDAIITNVQEKEENWWIGDYGGMIGGWFPKNHIEEVDHERAQQLLAEQAEPSLSNLEATMMDVDGLHVEPRPSKAHQRLIFRIVNHKQNQFLDVGADDEDEMKEWAKKIDEAAKMYNVQAQTVQLMQRQMKIAKEMSDLIYYCYPVPFQDFETSQTFPYNAMSSWNERKAAAVCADRGPNANPVAFNLYNRRQLSRVYPHGRRLDSSNFDPQQMWNCGIQLVALNFQTPTSPMWLHHGKFLQNGNCGYLLKPKAMLDPAVLFNPHQPSTFMMHVDQVKLSITVVSARHLNKKVSGKGLVSPFVELEINGVPKDARRVKTRTISDNGFNPVWNERFDFKVRFPEMACLSVVVYDEDTFGDAVVVGQSVIPIGSKDSPTLLSGWRSVQLYNVYSHEMPLSSVLLHISKTYLPRSTDDCPVREQRKSRQSVRRESGGGMRLDSSGGASALAGVAKAVIPPDNRPDPKKPAAVPALSSGTSPSKP
eukprot:m.19984 g.19984  ORF g.19984 m.19984 type:complete len:1333 (+) comp3742_c0_seq1:562-4560(+)